MRAKVGSDKAKLVADCRNFAGKGLLIEVMTGGVTVYFAFGSEGQNELETSGSVTPGDGFTMDSTSGRLVIPDFADVLYAIVAQGAPIAEVFAMDYQARVMVKRKPVAAKGWAARALRDAGR
jgi:hypothetical protein